jgi:hypothetical protein
MKTIGLRLDAATHSRLKRHVRSRGETISAFVRAAIIKSLPFDRPRENTYESWERLTRDSVGSGHSDLSTTYKARFRDIVRAKHRRGRA